MRYSIFHIWTLFFYKTHLCRLRNISVWKASVWFSTTCRSPGKRKIYMSFQAWKQHFVCEINFEFFFETYHWHILFLKYILYFFLNQRFVRSEFFCRKHGTLLGVTLSFRGKLLITCTFVFLIQFEISYWKQSLTHIFYILFFVFTTTTTVFVLFVLFVFGVEK